MRNTYLSLIAAGLIIAVVSFFALGYGVAEAPATEGAAIKPRSAPALVQPPTSSTPALNATPLNNSSRASVLRQPREIQDAAGQTVVASDGNVVDQKTRFRPGQRNVLVIHGWNAAPGDDCNKILTDFAASIYQNVLVYQYPSAGDMAENARWLYERLLPLLATPDTQFDIIAYSAGGLVARVAKEPSALNDGKAIGAQVRNLVTIATPHEGLDQWVNRVVEMSPADASFLGVDQMMKGSPFLLKLNANPNQGDTRYFTIAGRYEGLPSDGIVLISSAHAEGALKITDRATFNRSHAQMGCYGDVLSAIGRWLKAP